MESLLIKRGEIVYNNNKEKWGKLYMNKIIAIEVEWKKLGGVGETIDEAYKNAIKKYPNKPFYFRRVGPCAAAGYLFLLHHKG